MLPRTRLHPRSTQRVHAQVSGGLLLDQLRRSRWLRRPCRHGDPPIRRPLIVVQARIRDRDEILHTYLPPFCRCYSRPTHHPRFVSRSPIGHVTAARQLVGYMKLFSSYEAEARADTGYGLTGADDVFVVPLRLPAPDTPLMYGCAA
jgi:hypothetical protein